MWVTTQRTMRLTDARTAVLGGIRVPLGPREWWSVDLLFGSRFSLWGFCLMNESKSKKNAPLHDGFEWAGAVARVRRGSSARVARPSRRLAEHADRGLRQFEPWRPDHRSDRWRALTVQEPRPTPARLPRSTQNKRNKREHEPNLFLDAQRPERFGLFIERRLAHARIVLTTWPATSVRRKSRPWKR